MTKWFAVVALATGGCEEAVPREQTDPKPTPVVAPAPAKPAPAVSAPRTLPTSRPACGSPPCAPRTLPDGRPAPGNVTSRVPTRELH